MEGVQMAYVLNKLTPNLIVSDVARSVAFYRDVLGFSVQQTVPDAAPFVFAIVTSGPVEIFLNSRDAAVQEYPAFKDRPIGVARPAADSSAVCEPVAIHPGATAFAVIPCGPSASARPRMSPSIPAFAAP